MTPPTTSTTHPTTAGSATGDRVDIAVVGGGLAGPTTAAICARAGARVLVFDARDTLGGRARSADDAGYRLDEGAHALYLEGEARRILASLGIDPGGRTPPTGGTILAGDAAHALPVTPLALARTSLFTMADRVSAGRPLAGLGRVDARALDGVSVTDWLTTATRRARVRGLLRALVRLSTYCDDPDHPSAGAAVDQLRLARGGVRSVEEGGRSSMPSPPISVHAPVAARVPPDAALVSTISYRPADRAEHEGLLDRSDPTWRSRAVVERHGAHRVAATAIPTAARDQSDRRPGPDRRLRGPARPPVRAGLPDDRQHRRRRGRRVGGLAALARHRPFPHRQPGRLADHRGHPSGPRPTPLGPAPAPGRHRALAPRCSPRTSSVVSTGPGPHERSDPGPARSTPSARPGGSSHRADRPISLP